jgi:hypothetical protein
MRYYGYSAREARGFPARRDLILSGRGAARYRPPFAVSVNEVRGEALMAGQARRGRKLFGGIVLAILVAGVVVVWAERSPLLSWYCVRGLSRSDEVGRDLWVDRIAGLGEATVPDLLEGLADPDPAVCANVRTALVRLSVDWGAADPRCVNLATGITRAWDNFSGAGKSEALEVASCWFRGDSEAAPGLVAAGARLLTLSAHADSAEAQPHALALCAALLAQRGGSEAVSPARGLVRANLSSADAATRILAVRLALHPGMDLLEDVTPLLNDPAAEVRRAAVIAVGPSEQAVRDEGLLPCLHDPDPEVRRLGELALRGRGLRPEHIKLGRILTDPSPGVRLQVLDYLGRASDLDAGIWLRRLSHDPSPAVRAAAMRAMSQQTAVDLTDRIDQMARNDPSPTVCVLARYYLKHTRSPEAE